MSSAAEIEAIIQREARCLDLELWDEWLNLFTEDCQYWVPATRGQQEARTQVSLFFEDRTLMETRIKRLLHPAAHSLARPLRTSRLVAGVIIEKYGPEDEVVASSSFHMLEQYGERQRLFAGTYTHQLTSSFGKYRIRTKRVDLTNCDLPMEAIETFL